MSRRSHFTLDVSQLGPFGLWLAMRGWSRVGTKGPYEAARFVHPVEIPMLLFRNDRVRGVLTVQDKDIPLVRAFLTQKTKRAKRVDSPYREDYTQSQQGVGG